MLYIFKKSMDGIREKLFMKQALCRAKQAFMNDEVPVGALILYQGKVLAENYNRCMQNNDPTAHAEMMVIKEATKLLKKRYLVDCDLYVTLEPCPMCCQAISFSRIRKVYFGAYDRKGGGVVFGPTIFNQPSCFHRPKIIGGILSSPCKSILQEFFRRKRQK